MRTTWGGLTPINCTRLAGGYEDLNFLFERETGVKKVVLDRNSAVFTAMRKGVTSEAVRALEFFLKGYWERLLELIKGSEVSVDVKTSEKDLAVEVLITGSPHSLVHKNQIEI